MAKDTMSNSKWASISNSEYDALLSNLKSDAARAHIELLEVKGNFSQSISSCSGFSYVLIFDQLHP